MKHESDNQLEQMQQFARMLCDRGFGMPALFFLEMYKPFTTVAGIIGEGFHPLLAAVLGAARTRELIEVLKDRDRYNRFLDVLEAQLNQTKVNGATRGS